MLLTAGWKQGSCIDAQEALQKIPDIHEYHQKLLKNISNGLLIITLYDCAIINGSFEKEPWLSYVIAKPIASVNNANALSKNNRILHLSLSVDNEPRPFEIDAGSFGIFRREALLKLSPMKSITFHEKTHRVFIKWIQRRITQATFPDSFDRRLKKNKLGKLFDQYDDNNVTGVYLRLSPRHKELPETEEYKVSIFVAVDDSNARNFIHA